MNEQPKEVPLTEREKRKARKKPSIFRNDPNVNLEWRGWMS